MSTLFKRKLNEIHDIIIGDKNFIKRVYYADKLLYL